MLSAGHYVGPYVRRIGDVVPAERVRQAKRLPALPHLQHCRDVENAGTGARGSASVEQTLSATGKRIGLASVREGEVVGGIEMVGLLAPGTDRLAEADVQWHQAAANVGISGIEDSPTGFVLIEAQREQ